ncbi:ATP-binding protein [Planctomicrobium sp. SH668]|uniref:ATP-binding protein n=1 Tax=Planctomicrobium sp. SH668 TaxID=3448126 RepID=UPI003F5C9900
MTNWIHAISDVLIFASFVLIPIVLWSLLKKRTDVALARVWFFLAALFLTTATLQLLDSIIVVGPLAPFSNTIKIVTAIVSWATLIALIFAMPVLKKIRRQTELEHEIRESALELQLVNLRLQEHDDRLRIAMQAGRMGAWSWNLLTNALWMDQACLEITGLKIPSNQLRFDQFIKNVHPDDKAELELQIQEAINKKTNFTSVFRFYVDGKGYRFLQTRGAVSYGPNGEENRIYGVDLDVTDLVIDQESLRVNTRAIEAVKNGIIITDSRLPHNPIIYVNPAFEELTGYPSSEVIGRSCKFLQGAGTNAETVKTIREAIRERKECQVTILNYRKDGTPFWNNLQISPVENDEGEISHFVGIQNDVTARVRAERRLKDAQQTAEQANRAKSEFLANMSHEIRTPLTAILGCADSLCRELKHGDAHATASTIRSQCQLLTGILNDVLDLSKIEADKLEINKEQCSIIAIITEMKALWEPQINDKNLELLIEYDNYLPETILTDPIRLRQVLFNLIGNAIKFTDKGHIALKFQCRTEGSSLNLVISVSDTGVGIPPEHLEVIFQAFKQVDGLSRRRASGTGLGLTISQRLIKLLGGKLTVSSQVGVGSTFTIALPIERVSFVSTDAATYQQHLKESGDSVNIQIPIKVLVAEDTPSVQFMLKRMLAPVVLEVRVVDNGKEAVQAVLDADKSQPFDLVLMDIQMPVMDGYQATEKLRELGQNIPVIALTASAMEGDRERCIEVGCSGYIAKPIQHSLLISALQACSGEIRQRS